MENRCCGASREISHIETDKLNPVVANGKLVGIATSTDLIKYLLSQF
jgi:CBS domain-containing protein